MNFLHKWIHVNPKFYQRLNAGEKNMISMLAYSVPVSSIVAGIVFYYSFYLLLNSAFISLLGASFIAYLMYLHDSTLLSEEGTTRSIARLVASVIIAVIVAVPLKIEFMGDSIGKQYVATINAKNLEFDRLAAEAKSKIYEEERTIMASVKDAGDNFDKTSSSQGLVEARRAKDAFLANKKSRLTEIENRFNAQKLPLEYSKLDLATSFFSNMFGGSTKDVFMNLTVLVILLFIEALPAAIRLKLENGNYIARTRHHQAMREKTDVEMEVIQEKIFKLEDLDSLEDYVNEAAIRKQLETAFENDFEDPQRLLELAQKIKRDKLKSNSQPHPERNQNHNTNANYKPKKDDDDFTQFEYNNQPAA